MDNVKKVRVALAFSEYAPGTFKFAAQFAQGTGAELSIASVINMRDVESVRTIWAMGYKVDGEHYIQSIRDERHTVRARLAAQAQYPLERLRIFMPVGHPIDEILRLVFKEEIDVVVMGPKGRTDLEHVLVGSVAEKVFRRSPATVISYRDPRMAERMKQRLEGL
jgi:nucleotide-binding universal stress UspA family protein